VAFSFLKPDNLYTKYTASKRHTELLTRPFPEFVRIARNRPAENTDPTYPNVTDGTTASTVRKTPKRVIQQLPTGVVTCEVEDWLPVVADFKYRTEILPNANLEYDLLQKCWNVLETALTLGVCATYTPFVKHAKGFGPDLSVIYWGDLAIQPGKKSGEASSYVFVRSWWQKEDIEALIDREKKLKKQAKERGEEYDSSWDIRALEEIKDGGSTKDQQAKTPTELERNLDVSGVELITGFQEGVDAVFYTFSPRLETIVRTEPNVDPRGKIPIDWCYGDIDGSNPMGRGIPELVGGLQNLIDSGMQMYQYNRALMLAPPMVKYGQFSGVKLAPHAVITKYSPEATLETLKIDTSAVANYPALYGLQKSQLLNLVNSPDTSISAEVGNPGFGKTPAAVNQQKATISVDDNYVRKMFEAWFEDWSETAINIYFAKKHGVEEVQLDDDTANKLRKLADEGKFDINLLSDDDKIMIDFDTATAALHFSVDASTSKKNDDAMQLDALNGLLTIYGSSQVLQSVIPQEKIIGVWNAMVTASSVQDPEELTIDVKEFLAQQQQAQAMQQQQIDAQTAQAQAVQTQTAQQPQMQPQSPQMPQGMPQQMPMQSEEMQPQEQGELSEEDYQIIDQLKALGMNDNVIAQAIDDLNQGMHEDEVLARIGAAYAG